MASLGQQVLRILSGIICLIVSRFLWNFFNSPLKSFPGPLASSFSNLWRFFNVLGHRAERTHIELHKKHGSAVRMGPKIISLSDPDFIGTVFSTRDPWKKSDQSKPNDVLDQHRTRISNLFGTQDEAWHSRTIKPIRGLYTMTKALDMEKHCNKILDLFTSLLDERFVNRKKICDMSQYLQFYAWDSMSNMTFGQTCGLLESGRDDNNVISVNTRAHRYFAAISQIPQLDLVLDKNPVYRIGPPPFTWAHVQATQAVAKRKKEPTDSVYSRESDFLDKLLEAQKRDPDMIDDSLVANYLLNNILPGSDTTAIYMTAALYYILKTPGVLKKLKGELDPSKIQTPVSWNATQELPYFEAVMKEAQRIHPGVGLMLERVVPESGLKLPDGGFLPPGTIVGMNPWVVNRSEKYFGENPDEFNPERWLRQGGESDELFKERRNKMKAGDLTFGGGSRICLGRNLAIIQAFKMLATLLIKYDISLADPAEEWHVHNDWFVYQEGVRVKFAHRKVN